MLKKTTAMTVRQNLGELLNEVQYRHDSILITKAGKPVAALVDIGLFNRINTLDKAFKQFTDEMARAYEEETPERVIKELDEALKVARSE